MANRKSIPVVFQINHSINSFLGRRRGGWGL